MIHDETSLIHFERMRRYFGKPVVKILTSKKGEVLGVNDFELRFWVIQSPLEQRNTWKLSAYGANQA